MMLGRNQIWMGQLASDKGGRRLRWTVLKAVEAEEVWGSWASSWRKGPLNWAWASSGQGQRQTFVKWIGVWGGELSAVLSSLVL